MIINYSTITEQQQHTLISNLDSIFSNNEKILLKTLTSSDRHDYTSVLLPVNFNKKYIFLFFVFDFLDSKCWCTR
jgi:hypothetical protein